MVECRDTDVPIHALGAVAKTFPFTVVFTISNTERSMHTFPHTHSWERWSCVHIKVYDLTHNPQYRLSLQSPREPAGC